MTEWNIKNIRARVFTGGDQLEILERILDWAKDTRPISILSFAFRMIDDEDSIEVFYEELIGGFSDETIKE